MDITKIFEMMPSRYRKGSVSGSKTFYFSIGDHKYTVRIDADDCRVESGKTVEKADIVLKTTPELFDKMVLKQKMPSPLDIARGKIKTNDPIGLAKIKDYFDLSH